MLRRLLYVIPTVTAAIAGFALVGPGKARGLDAARILGAPDADGRVRSLRVVAAHREDQRDTPVMGEIRVESGRVVSVATLGSNGIGEVKLDRPVGLGDDVIVTMGGRVLLRGALRDPGNSTDNLIVTTAGFGKHEGSLHLSSHLARGPLVPPFGDTVTTDIADAQGKPVQAIVDARFDGATCPDCSVASALATTVRHGVVPIGDQVEVEMTARSADGRTGSFVGKLPTALGSYWLAPPSSEPELRLLAATPKEWAFVSLFDENSRVGGRVVALAERSDGFYEGSFERTPAELDARYAVVASDEGETARTTSAWSLRREPPSGEPKALRRVVKLQDGFPEATRREGERLRRVHFVLAGFVMALAFLEIALLGALARGTRRDLTEHFKSSAEPADDTVATPAIQPIRSTLAVLVVVALLVALSTAALVALTLVAR